MCVHKTCVWSRVCVLTLVGSRRKTRQQWCNLVATGLRPRRLTFLCVIGQIENTDKGKSGINAQTHFIREAYVEILKDHFGANAIVSVSFPSKQELNECQRSRRRHTVHCCLECPSSSSSHLLPCVLMSSTYRCSAITLEKLKDRNSVLFFHMEWSCCWNN